MTYEVVLIDDHALVREGLREALTRQSDLTVVGEARSSKEAIDLCESTRPHAVVLDLNLGRDSGLTLIAELRRRQPAIKIVVLSRYDEFVFAERTLRLGANGYVMKDQNSTVVIEALRRVLSGKTYLSETVTDRLFKAFGSGASLNGGRQGLERLSDRELEVLHLLGQGHQTKEIAEHLGISAKTVETHQGKLKEKLALTTGRQLVVLAVRWLRDGHLDFASSPDRED